MTPNPPGHGMTTNGDHVGDCRRRIERAIVRGLRDEGILNSQHTEDDRITWSVEGDWAIIVVPEPATRVEALEQALIPFVFIGRASMERLGLAKEYDEARNLLDLLRTR